MCNAEGTTLGGERAKNRLIEKKMVNITRMFKGVEKLNSEFWGLRYMMKIMVLNYLDRKNISKGEI